MIIHPNVQLKSLLVLAPKALETFRLENENDFDYVICLNVFSRILKKYSPETFILLFFSRKVITVILVNRGRLSPLQIAER